MKAGDQVVLKQIDKDDLYYPKRNELIGKTFTVDRVGTYWGGGWRAIGLRSLKKAGESFYFYKARVVGEKKGGQK